MQSIDIHRFSVATIFKLIGIGLLFSLFPASIVFGAVCGLGWLTMYYNGEPIHGWQPVVVAPFLGLMLVPVLTALLGLSVSLGLWLYSLLGPYSIAFRPAPEPRA